MSSNYIFDKASAQFERDFDAKLWIKRDLSHFIQKKKKITEVWHVKTVEKLQ